MTRLALVAILVVATAASFTSAAVDSNSRKLLAASCLYPPMDSLAIPDPKYEILSVISTGKVIYYCVNGTTDPTHGEAFSNLRSDDGQWVGFFEYPISGPNLGQPTYTMTNTVTGENRTIWGENKPQVKKESPEGYGVSWSRRVIYGDTSTLDQKMANGTVIPSGPKATYVLRNETWDAGKPVGSTCDGDQDIEVPYTARHTFYSCEWWLFPPPSAAPAPLPAAPPVPALAPIVPVPAPLPAPVPVPAPVVAPVPVPAPEPVVVPEPVLPVEPVAVPAPPSSASKTATAAALVVVAMVGAMV